MIVAPNFHALLKAMYPVRPLPAVDRPDPYYGDRKTLYIGGGWHSLLRRTR